jgi:hypothetical protein
VKLQFWFEFASTYSYPAVMRVGKMAAARTGYRRSGLIRDSGSSCEPWPARNSEPVMVGGSTASLTTSRSKPSATTSGGGRLLSCFCSGLARPLHGLLGLLRTAGVRGGRDLDV